MSLHSDGVSFIQKELSISDVRVIHWKKSCKKVIQECYPKRIIEERLATLLEGAGYLFNRKFKAKLFYLFFGVLSVKIGLLS